MRKYCTRKLHLSRLLALSLALEVGLLSKCLLLKHPVRNWPTFLEVDGSSDDLDIPIKRAYQDVEFVKKHNLFSINSINWARILIQMAHYYFAYFQVCLGQI